MNRSPIHALLTVICLACVPAWGQSDAIELMNPAAVGPAAPGPASPVQPAVDLLAEAAKPDSQVVVRVTFDIAKPYHIQSNRAAESWIVPTTIELADAPPGVSIGRIAWPETKDLTVDFGEGPQKLPFFVGTARAYVFVKFDQGVPLGEHTVRFALGWQACDDTSCLVPEQAEIDLTIDVVDPSTPIRSTPLPPGIERPSSSGDSLDLKFFGWDFDINPNVTWLLLLFAAIGGLMLNLTPCVLPMVPIKVMSLSRAASGSRGRALALGVVMSLGVVVFWLAIAMAIGALANFDSINALFQELWFTIGVGLVIGVMALGMLGLFATGLPRWVYRINPSQETLAGSFGFGIMTAVLATPCTAPFMGTAAAWATTQPTATTLSTFTAIGVGMALPYLLLAAFPRLLGFVPRTGPASELVKQVMGLLMIAAAAYFIGTGAAGALNQPPDPVSKLYWWPVGVTIGIAGAWLAWRVIRITASPLPRVVFGIAGLSLALGGLWLAFTMTQASPINWRYYTPERLAAAQQRGEVVVLDFTAEWCLNCHALERAVLERPPVVEALNADGVAAIKVDITKYKPAQALLTEYGSRTIPLLVVLDRAGNEAFRSDAYTVGEVLQAVSSAASEPFDPPLQASDDGS